jgi:hypothetical protein
LPFRRAWLDLWWWCAPRVPHTHENDEQSGSRDLQIMKSSREGSQRLFAGRVPKSTLLRGTYPALRTISGINLSVRLKLGGILIPYLASNQYIRTGTAKRKIHQKLTNSSCRLLTGKIVPPTGGFPSLKLAPLTVGLRSNVRTFDPCVFMMNRLRCRCVLNLRFCASARWQNAARRVL